LYESPFDRIKAGLKKIEIRLFDKKRQRIKIGDKIIFSKLPDMDETLQIEVIGLQRFATFEELLNALPMSSFGYPEDHDKQVFTESLHKIYSAEDEKKYGILCIAIRLLSS